MCWSGDDLRLRTSLRLFVRSWILCIFCFHFFVFVAIKIKLNQCAGQDILSRVMRKPTFCICVNKDTDQLRSNC